VRRILVAGELNADLVLTGLPTLPQLGRELLAEGFQLALGSSSAITAARLAALGATVDFVGYIAADEIGRFVLKELKKFGVGVHSIRTIAIGVTGVTVSLTYAHDRALLTYPGVMAVFDGANITPEMLRDYVHLHVGSFFLQPALQPELPRLFALARAAGLTTSLDVGWDPQEQWLDNPFLAHTLEQTDIFLPNETEAKALNVGQWPPVGLAGKIKQTLVIKRGAQGAWAFAAGDKTPVVVGAYPVEVVDTTGAGDAFNAGFLYAAVVRQDSLPVALAFATACGAQAVTQVGGATNAPSAAVIEDHTA